MSCKAAPVVINFSGIYYYSADELKEYDGAFFHGCAKTVRKIIEKKNISTENYLYATYNKGKGKWTISDHKKPSNKAKLYLLDTWVESNVPKMMDVFEDCETVYEFKPAPPIIELKDSEKFKDNKGNCMYIETRGERSINGIYFKVSDVSKVFGITRLQDVVLNKNGGFNVSEDYEYFIDTNPIKNEKNTCKSLYLTYEGVLSVLYRSHTNSAKVFRNWATETLFVHQMGTVEQKKELSNKLLGVPCDTAREFVNMNKAKISCVYLLNLGYVKDLRTKMSLNDTIDDTDLILKFGLTDNFDRRLREHSTKTFKGIDFTVMNYAFIDATEIADAEQDVAEFFKDDVDGIDIKYNNSKEIFAVANNKNVLKMVKKQYEIIAERYKGSVANIINEIEKLKKDHKLELERKDFELYKVQNENNMLQQLLQHTKETAKNHLEIKSLENEKIQLKLENVELQLKINCM